MDVLKAMIDFGCYFTIGVEVLYSDYIKANRQAVPDRLLLTETDNPGALKWLKKNDEVGMPLAITDVVNAVATLRHSTPAEITRDRSRQLRAHDSRRSASMMRIRQIVDV